LALLYRSGASGRSAAIRSKAKKGYTAEMPSRPREFHREHPVTGGSRPPPVPTERSVRFSRTTLFKIPFLQSRASDALIATTVIICMIGTALPYTSVGGALGFVPLPSLYWPLVFLIVASYAAMTHFVKVWFVRRWGM